MFTRSIGIAVLTLGASSILTSPAQAACSTVANTSDWGTNCTTSFTANKRSDFTNAIQRVLNFEGFDAGPNDGDFGQRTYEAVKRFQTARGLVADGIVGPNTWRALKAELFNPRDSVCAGWTIYSETNSSGATGIPNFRRNESTGVWQVARVGTGGITNCTSSDWVRMDTSAP